MGGALFCVWRLFGEGQVGLLPVGSSDVEAVGASLDEGEVLIVGDAEDAPSVDAQDHVAGPESPLVVRAALAHHADGDTSGHRHEGYLRGAVAHAAYTVVLIRLESHRLEVGEHREHTVGQKAGADA